MGYKKLSNKLRVIANAFIRESKKYYADKPFKETIPMSTKRLQKLLYLCEIEYMKKHGGKHLFKEEFYAWPSGPAIPDVYTAYLLYALPNEELPCIGIPTAEEQMLINNIISLTAKIDTVDLVAICSIEGGPWSTVYDVDDRKHKQIISKEDACRFYLTKDLKLDVLKVQ